MIDRVLHSQNPKLTSARWRPADLDVAPIRVHMVPINRHLAKRLGRFASVLTGAHVSDPSPKSINRRGVYVYVVSEGRYSLKWFNSQKGFGFIQL